MASQRQDHPLRGLLIPDTRLNNDTLVTTGFTEQGPRAGGVAIPYSDTRGVFELSGDQDTLVSLEVAEGGFPGRARYLYSYGTGQNLGWDASSLLTGYDAIFTGIYSPDLIDTIETGRGTLLSAATGAPGPVTTVIEYDPTDGSRTTITAPADIQDFIALSKDKSGNILWMSRAGSNTKIFRSILPFDPTSGWETHAINPISAFSTVVVKSRLMLSGNDFAAIFTTATTLEQYSSYDDAASFSFISSSTVVEADAAVSPTGRIIVVSINASADIQVRSIGSASESLSAATLTTLDSTNNWDQCWIGVDPIGRIYIYGQHTSHRLMYQWMSKDDGATWIFNSKPILGDDSVTAIGRPFQGNFVHCAGAMWFHGGAQAAGENHYLYKFGGWSDVNFVPLPDSNSIEDEDRPAAGYDTDGSVTLVPVNGIGSYANVVLTGTTPGAGVGSKQPSFRYTTTNSHALYPFGTNRSIAVRFELWAVNGSTATADAAMRVKLSDGANDKQLGMYADTTSMAIRDVRAGTTLATISSLSNTFYQWLILWDDIDTRLEIYYKLATDVVWTSAYQSSTTLTAGAGGTSAVEFGNFTANAAESCWRFIAITAGTSGPSALRRWWGARTSTDAVIDRTRLGGRLASSYPAPLWHRATTDSGFGRQTYVKIKDGPSQDGDTYYCPVAHDFPVSNIHYAASPSPRVKHRTTAVDPVTTLVPEQTFEWLPALGGETSLSRSIGFAILGANYHRAILEVYNSGTLAWDTIAQIDFDWGLTGLSFTRTGNTLRINGGATADRYIWRNELVGAHVSLGGAQIYKIVRHTEGVWGAASAKHVEIVIDCVEASEGGADAPPASGTLDIWCQNAVTAAHDLSVIEGRYRVRIPTQYTREGYFEHGIIMVGFVQAFGLQHSWGTNYKFETNAESFQSRSGTTRRRALGPVIPSWNIAWTDEQDLSRLRDTDPAPNFLSPIGDTEGMANYMDVPYLMSGLIEELKSGEIPVVCLAKIPDSTTVNDPTLFLYGRIVSSVQIENVQGNEGEDEVHRTQSITIEGIV